MYKQILKVHSQAGDVLQAIFHVVLWQFRADVETLGQWEIPWKHS